jgi:hypothetical protein
MSYHLTASQVQTLKDFILHFARKTLEATLYIPRSMEVQLGKGGGEDDKQPWLGHFLW